MRLLLDTHALIWQLEGNAAMSATVDSLIADRSNSVWVSMASAWEMAIKVQIGKLTLSPPFEEIFPRKLQAMGLNLLAIEIEHAKRFLELPPHHRDPFDRMLIAQAQSERMTLMTRDSIFQKYGVPVIW